MKRIDAFDKINKEDISFIVKVSSVLFSLLLFFREFYTKYYAFIPWNDDIPILDREPSMQLVYLIVTSLLLMLILLFHLSKKNETYRKVGLLFETILFTAVFTYFIYFSKNTVPEYKLLFLFLITSTVIQIGMVEGMLIAAYASLLILYFDLKFPLENGIIPQLNDDLMVAGVYFVVALVLGFYVKTVNQFIEEKNRHIEKLKRELLSKDEQQIYFEKILSTNATCYHLLVDASHDAILIHNETEILYINHTAMHLLGYQHPEEIHRKSIFEFLTASTVHDFSAHMETLFEEKNNHVVFASRIKMKDAQEIPVSFTSGYLLLDGAPAVISILRDISEREKVISLESDVKQREQLLHESREYNQFITDFFSNVSHELKTPLSVIVAANKMIGRKLPPQSMEKNSPNKYVHIIQQNCYRLTRLMNNLLDMSKINSGFIRPQLCRMDIIRVLEDMTLSVVAYAEIKQIRLIFDTDTEEKIMTFDPDKIERIILNLLSNAIKFTPPLGYIWVTLLDKGDSLSISVKDNGMGIPAEKQNLIFERFTQIDASLSKNYEGTGIGLSLVKAFVLMHQGSIDVNSKLGEGSEFIIDLPVLADAADMLEKIDYASYSERVHIEFSDIPTGPSGPNTSFS